MVSYGCAQSAPQEPCHGFASKAVKNIRSNLNRMYTSIPYPRLYTHRYYLRLLLIAQRPNTKGVCMIVATFVVGRMLIAAVCVGLLVFCDDYAARLWLGGGILAIGTPLVIYATRLNMRIGHDAGRCSATADMLRAHFKLQDKS